MYKHLGHVSWLALALAMALPTTSSLAETKAGVATKVENKVFGIRQGDSQPLAIGSEVFMDETVRTDDESTTQLLLLDKTDISVGMKSEIVIDRFVFDPNRPQGDVVINATKGAFRFVTGTQDHNSYTIKTPAATIGVRGTVLEWYTPPDVDYKNPGAKALQVLLKSGQIDVTPIFCGEKGCQKIIMNEVDKLLEVYVGGGTSVSNYSGSLYAAVTGTAGFGRGAAGAGGGGGGGGGGGSQLIKPLFTNTGTPTTTGGGGGGGGGNPFTFTLTPGVTPKTTTNTVSP
jgi:hypothetical protein